MKLSKHISGILILLFIFSSNVLAQDIRKFRICILSDTSFQQPEFEAQINQIAVLIKSSSFLHLKIFGYSNMEMVGEKDLQINFNSAQCKNLVKMILKKINRIEPIDKSKMTFDWIGRSEESEGLPRHYSKENGICVDIEVQMIR